MKHLTIALVMLVTTVSLFCAESSPECAGCVNTRDTKRRAINLHEAAWHQCVTCIRRLIKVGADVNAKNNNGDTPLHTATYYHNCQCIDALLEAGAQVNVHGYYGWTPLLNLAMNGCNDCRAVLIANGADPNAKNKHDHTPYTYLGTPLDKNTLDALQGKWSIPATRIVPTKKTKPKNISSNGSITPVFMVGFATCILAAVGGGIASATGSKDKPLDTNTTPEITIHNCQQDDDNCGLDGSEEALVNEQKPSPLQN